MLLRSLDRRQRRPGVVLLAVLVIIVILTLAAYQYSEWMMAEYEGTHSQIKAAQARELANSGIHYAAAMLANRDAYVNTLGGNPYDNPEVFAEVALPLTEDGRTGYFSLVTVGPGAPLSEEAPYRFGVSDESAKINVNALLLLDRGRGDRGYEVLLGLPDMTEDVAAAILDWIDTDTTPRPGGAEDEYYSTLPQPYMTKNGPLDSLEELLFVRGVTPQLLYGNDFNRNGILDPGEEDGSGVPYQGLSGFLTVYSRELNVDNEGYPRINLNEQDINALAEKLIPVVGQDLTDYIIAYRSNGGQPVPTDDGTGTTPLTGDGRSAVQSSNQSSRRGGRGRNRLRTLFDLVGSQVILGEGDSAVTFNSPLNDPGQAEQLLPILLDKTTLRSEMELRPRINVNTAPIEVLATIPGLEDGDAERIAANQPVFAVLGGVDPIYETHAWLKTRVNLSADKLRAIDRYITGRSLVYRVQAVGYFGGGGPTARVEAVIDTNAGRPRIVYWRNLGELGRGFDLTGTENVDGGLLP